MTSKVGLGVLPVCIVLALAACAPKGEALYARASTSLANGDANAAIIDLKNLLQAEPQNAKARAMLGKAFVATGQIQLAEVEIGKAKDLGAPADLLLVSNCNVMLFKGQFEQVLQDCSPDKGKAEQRRDLQVVTATALLALNRAPEAQAAFEAVVAAAPDDVEAWMGYASTMSVIGGLAAAKATLDKAPAAVKNDARYWLTLGAVNAGASAFTDAEVAYQTAVKKVEEQKLGGATRLMALGGLAETQLRQGNIAAAKATSEKLEEVASKNPMAMMLRGQIAAADGEYDEARSLLEQVVADMPSNANAWILLASVNVQQGQLDQAESHLKSVIAADPQNARAQHMLIDVRARQGSSAQDSLAGLRVAMEQSPNNPTMLATAGRLSLETGDRADALNYLADAAKASSKNDAEAQLTIANGYLQAGEADRALEILNAMPKGGATDGMRNSLLLTTLLAKGDTTQLMVESKAILAKSGKDAATRNLVGSAYAAAGKKDLAREQFNEALKLEPDNASALLSLARMDLDAGKFEPAEARLKQVVAKDPKNLMATLGLAATAAKRNDSAAVEKYLAQAVKDHPESVQAQVSMAQHYLGAKQPDKAKAVADAMVAANPRDAQAANARGIVMVSLKDLPGAISSFEQARNLDPKSQEIAGNLARAQLLNKDVNGALSTLDRALGENPKSIPLLALASGVSLQAGNMERATGYIERLKQAAPGSAVSAQMEGDLAMSQKRFADAFALYGQADPKMQNRPVTLARYVAAQQAKVSEPERVLEQWLDAHPDDAEVIGMLGEGKRVRGDVDGAIRTYEQALAKAPDSPVLNNNLAMLFLDKGDPRALALAEKAYKAMPKAPAIQDTYGWALLQAGKTDRAVEVLLEAAKGMPNSAEVQYHLAAALSKAGRTAEALPAAQKAAAGRLPPSLQADAAKLLRDLQ